MGSPSKRWGGKGEEQGQGVYPLDFLHPYVVSCDTDSVPCVPDVLHDCVGFHVLETVSPFILQFPSIQTTPLLLAQVPALSLEIWNESLCKSLFDMFLSVASVSCWDPA